MFLSFQTNESDKRPPTMDRLQKLGFGRRSHSTDSRTPPEKSGRRSSDKTERLRELTELLRSSVTRNHQAPTPPPRRPRITQSLEKTISEYPSGSESLEDVTEMHEGGVMTDTTPSPRSSLYKTLRPIASVSNLDTLVFNKNSKKSPPIAQKEDDYPTMSRTDSKLSLAGGTQKSLPFRSASFSQVDYTSGKYIRNALGALKAAFTKEKEISVVDSANLTLPRSKGNSRNASPKRDDFANFVKDRSHDELRSHDLSEEDVILEEKPISSIELFEDVSISEVPSDEAILNETNMAQTSEITLETLPEEDTSIEIQQDVPFLQTATTCLIPVPVYECVVGEWNAENPSNEWIDAKEDEVPKLIEEMGVSLDMIKEINECDIASDQLIDTCNQVHDDIINNDNRPPSTIDDIELDLANQDIIQKDETDQKEIVNNETLQTDPNVNPNYVEVRKRHSNNQENGRKESMLCNNSSTDSQNSNTIQNTEIERRRCVDKTRRRKGIYIQWPAITKSTEDGDSDQLTDENLTPEESKIVAWTGDNLKCDLASMKSMSVSDDDHRSKKYSECSIEPQTPEYEMSHPTFALLARRKSLTCQSSEEKDEISSGSPSLRASKNLLFLRQDSISDNESDKTPPRERHSASPAPYGDDLKRYSKRPVRGPYGQMMEAEMKKPNKLIHDERLEELHTHDHKQLTIPTALNRGKSLGSHSFDDSVTTKHENKQKLSGHLPIPCHIRAASTPSNMDTLPSTDQLVAHHKRYPSSIEPFNLRESEKRLSDKKLSLDSCDKIHKRSSQDLSSKRNSGCSDRHRGYIDAHRLSTSSRSPSERSILTLNTPETPKMNILPTPELLAELLKGSSERAASEHRKMNSPLSGGGLSTALPTAVLQCLVSKSTF